MRLRTLATAGLVLGACTFDDTVPAGIEVFCTVKADCPLGLECGPPLVGEEKMSCRTDVTPPTLLTASRVEVVSAPPGAVALLGAGFVATAAAPLARVRVTLVFDEPLRAAPSLTLGPVTLVGLKIAGSPEQSSWEFEGVVPALVPDVTVQPAGVAVDEVGNAGPYELAVALTFDGTPPAAIDTSVPGARLLRDPWKKSAPRFSVEATTGNEPVTVVALGALNVPLGQGAFGAGAAFTLPLVSDTAGLSLVAVDGAGNVSPTAALRRAVWTTRLTDVLGNPNTVIRRPVDRASHRLPSDERRPPSDGGVLDVPGDDAGVDVAAGGTWIYHGTSRAIEGPIAVAAGSAAFDSEWGQLMTFGGQAQLQQLSEQGHLWNGSAWTRATSAGVRARRYTALAFDPDRAKLLMFGGEVPGAGASGGPLLLADTWEFDNQRHEWKPFLVAGPEGRSRHAMAYHPGLRQIVLVGGYSASGNALDDTWAWNGAEWTWLDAGAPPRMDLGVATDPVASRLVLTGGAAGAGADAGPSPDTWVMTGTRWVKVDDVGPTVRSPQLYFDTKQQRMLALGKTPARWIFGADGGTTWSLTSSLFVNGAVTAVWDPNHQQLYVLQNVPPPPCMGMFCPMAASTPGLYVDKGDGGLAEVWTRTGAAPSAREHHVMGSDLSGNVYLFGGEGDRGELNDTYLWASGHWVAVSTASAPPRRQLAGLGGDGSDSLVLFGGKSDAGLYADAWLLEHGQTWRWLDAGSGPAPREGFGMDFAIGTPASSVVVGGRVSGALVQSDVWLYVRDIAGGGDGHWTQSGSLPAGMADLVVSGSALGSTIAVGRLAGSTGMVTVPIAAGQPGPPEVDSPPFGPRTGFAMADEGTGAVLFGGLSGGGGGLQPTARESDTWRRTNGAWSQLDISDPEGDQGPVQRSGHAMASFKSGFGTLLMGGRDETGLLDDTWELSFSRETPAIIIELDVSLAGFPAGATFRAATADVTARTNSSHRISNSVIHESRLDVWDLETWTPVSGDAGTLVPLTFSTRDPARLRALLTGRPSLSLRVAPQTSSGLGVASVFVDRALLVVEYDLP